MKSSSNRTSTKSVKNSTGRTTNKLTKSDAYGLNSLCEDMLKDIYWTEKALITVFPKMVKKATSQKLIDALEHHLDETKGQIERCVQIFGIADITARAKKSEVMNSLIKENQEFMESTENKLVRDAGIIAASQKVEYYEIASYGSMLAISEILGENEIVKLLNQTLKEEKHAVKKLTKLADHSITIC